MMKSAKMLGLGKGFGGLAVAGFVLATAILLGGWRKTEGDSADFRESATFDVVSADGAIHLLFGLPDEADGERLRFYYTRSADAGETWAEAAEVATDHALPGRHGRGNDPQLAVSGENAMAVWTARGGGPFGSGPLAAAVSRDGGRSWRVSAAPAYAGGGEKVGFRFPDLAACERGFHAAWIHAEGEERSLRYARLDFGKEEWTMPRVVDDDICACCWNTVKAGEDGAVYILYRDQDPSDMALAVSRDSGESWERRGAVGEFDWHFNGCPHVGGGLALGAENAEGEPELVASVWTGNGEVSGAYLFRSGDGGRSWGDRRDLAVESPGRNTDVDSAGDGRYFAVWDEAGEGTARVVFAAESADGEAWSAPLRVSESGGFATHPRVVVANGEAVAFWTAEDADGARRMMVRQLSVEEARK